MWIKPMKSITKTVVSWLFSDFQEVCSLESEQTFQANIRCSSLWSWMPWRSAWIRSPRAQPGAVVPSSPESSLEVALIQRERPLLPWHPPPEIIDLHVFQFFSYCKHRYDSFQNLYMLDLKLKVSIGTFVSTCQAPTTGDAFHLFSFTFASFRIDVMFSSHRFCTFLVKFIPKDLISLLVLLLGFSLLLCSLSGYYLGIWNYWLQYVNFIS